MESRNPAFNANTLNRLDRTGGTDAWADAGSMTLNGTINKTGILVSLTVLSSMYAWSIADTALGHTLAIGAMVVNLILAFVIMYNQSKAVVLAPVYAVVEGFVLGSVAYMFERRTQGIALQAFIGTFGVLFVMLGAYRFRILRATERMRRVIGFAMMGIFVTYLVDIVMGFFGTNVPMVHESGPVGILFSLAVLGVAAFSFILDFDMVERAVASRAPKWMEWYAGFAILLTIVWLYLELLRFLSKLNRR